MAPTKPFGNPASAEILLIGHDPRLQSSQAQAEYAFFLDYLQRYAAAPTYGPEKRKYGLANALLDYVSALAGCRVPLERLYVTNLCNEFLQGTQSKGTVLIPEAEAERGYEEICRASGQGHFRLVISTSCQGFYHLARLGFLDESDERISLFVEQARPRKSAADRRVYATSGKAPFLEVCGVEFHHAGIPVVAVLHVKQWPLRTSALRYMEPMERAKQVIGAALK